MKHPSIEQKLLSLALETLTPKQKAVWEMYNYDRLTQEEIATQLKIRQQAVDKTLKAIESKVQKYCKQNKAAYILLKLERQIMSDEDE